MTMQDIRNLTFALQVILTILAMVALALLADALKIGRNPATLFNELVGLIAAAATLLVVVHYAMTRLERYLAHQLRLTERLRAIGGA